ncbi:MAG: agmatinase [Sphingomonadaceae bacterium]
MDPVFHLIGLPTDCNSSFERGAALAPPLIRDALWSDRGNTACENGMEIGRDFQLVDKGDLALTEGPGDDDLIRQVVAESLNEQGIPILLGGDHAVTYPVLQAMHAHYGQITILHVDAHPDLYDDFEGNPRSHASPFARIMENGLAARLVQVGIRTLNRHCREQAERFSVDIIGMRNFAPGNVPGLSGPVYVSLDLDGLDPAFAPGVSHPEPGGLNVRDVLNVLDRVTGEIVGADIVEFNPRFDVNGVTAIAAAKFVRELASRATANRKGMS